MALLLCYWSVILHCWLFAGPTGSGVLRSLALGTLQALIQRVGPGDAWAFSLPGVAGRLSKALIAAGARIQSGLWQACRVRQG